MQCSGSHREGNLGKGAGRQLLLNHGFEPFIQDLSSHIHASVYLYDRQDQIKRLQIASFMS